MYKQVETHKSALMYNKVEINPVATLEDGDGGVAHIWIDDNCYVLGFADLYGKKYNWPATHIFPEAFQVLKSLPELKTKRG